MKKTYLILSAWIALLLMSQVAEAQLINPVTDTIVMGPGYANEIYYSMSSGNKGTVNRKQWDIAFRTSSMSASILTNDAANNNALGINGVELYTYGNGDISTWNAIDTSGFSTWKLLVNSTTDWEEGAFCRNQLGHPDYGWGVYNTVTHDVVGDSLYLIKLRDGSFRKLWIVRKYSSLNTYEFRYANLDGSGDTTVTLDCNPYESRNFVGYSLTTNEVVDFEPVTSTEWDILFTKYMYTYPNGVLYAVVGTLSNYNTKVNVVSSVPADYRIFHLDNMDSTRSPIGWEWKSFTGSGYAIVDSLVYFVQDQNGNIHRLVFKEFVGTSSGRIVLEKELLSLASIDEKPVNYSNLATYPNPAVNELNVIINPGKHSTVELTLTDLSGRSILKNTFAVTKNELNTLKIEVTGIPSGIYIASAELGSSFLTRKVVIKH